MKNYPHILSYLALSLLAACGGGGDSPSTASSDTNQPKIECNAECQAGRKAAEEAEKAKAEAERKAAEEAEKAKVETERKAAEEAEKAKVEADRKAVEEAEKAKVEAERKAAEEAEKAKVEAERKAAEEAEKAKVEAERKAAEEAEKAKAEAERKAAEEAEKTKVEAERKAAEKAKAEAERKAAEEAEKAKAEAERKAAEEAEKARVEAERKAAEEAEKAKAETERKAAEEAEKAKAEAERKAAEAAVATQQIDGYYSKISQSGMEGDDISHIGDINILEVDGQKISLVPVSPQRDEVFGIEDDEHKFSLVAATHLKYGRYGSYGLRNENGDIHTSYMFYQGVITPEAAMPQEGQAFYRGYALYSDIGQANTFGNSIFMVDFGRKSLSGAVYSENGEFDEVNLEGQIVGNRFFHMDEKEQKIMSGMFLGPQAEELTGRFDHLLESKNGTFGAAALKE